MDHNSAELMEDLVLDVKTKPKFKNFPARTNKVENTPCRNLKVEMQTLYISQESEKQIYNTLKHIYGPDFKLCDASEFENKNSRLGNQYWVERSKLIVKGAIDYSCKTTEPKSQDEITAQFALSRLQTYSFHDLHCMEALIHTKGHIGKALEILFSKYYGLENESVKKNNLLEYSANDLLERQQEEKEALQSIYGDIFVEKIMNRIWIFQINLNYLINGKKEEPVVKKKEKVEKEVCRLFIHRKCKFGNKCRFLHQQPQQVSQQAQSQLKEDSCYTLEIRFPEGCKYPYEPPYLYLYKSDSNYSKINCLRIIRRLYNEALALALEGTPSIFSIISLLENEHEIITYLEENKEQFLDENDMLFPPEIIDDTNLATHNQLGSINKRNRDNISWEDVTKEDDFIQKRFKEKQKDPNYIKMKEVRRKLPAWSEMDNVIKMVDKNQVTIISGETGCGKSTQIPQFLLDDWLVNRSQNKEHVNIICTEPRRISAMGVAQRIAAERSEQVGKVVGYQVRLESAVSNNTRLTFCTIGVLLQKLSVNPCLTNVTHIIVDEVHERSAESDFLLLLLKQLLPIRSNLKVILMSATLKTDAFSSYFGKIPILSIPGKMFPVEQIFLEDILEKTDYVLDINSEFVRKIKRNWNEISIDLETASITGESMSLPKENILDENLTVAQIIGRYQNYSCRTYKNLYLMDPDKINNELIEAVLEWILFGNHNYPKTGSILIFLPGIAEINSLKDLLFENEKLNPKNKNIKILSLHSSFTSEEQNLVFEKFGPNNRKIIISTNLAETSITIDDCTFVIDIGKMKEMRFNSCQNMESLETLWISRANALQRKGRAGRVMPGVCIHLYTSHRFKYHFAAQPVPEVLRIPLETLLLRIRILHKTEKINLYKTLEGMLDPPKEDNISSAIKHLQDIGAFDSQHMLTPLGHHLAALPVDVRIGKLILLGAIFCCLDSALTIAACLSYKDPFTTSSREQKGNPRKEFFTANSDHLTTLKAYRKWLEACARSTYAGKIFANEKSLSINTLHMLAKLKYQLLELLVSIGFVPVNLPKRQNSVDTVLEITGSELNINNENYKLLQGLLCAALYPNVVKVFTPEQSFQMQSVGAVPMQLKPEELKFRTRHNDFVSIHNSSVISNVGYFSSPYLVFQGKIKTKKIYIKDVSMVPILSLILFSGYELKIESHNESFILSLEDGWILFRIECHKVGQLLKHIRTELVKLLEQKMQDPLLNLLNHQNGKRIIHTIMSIVTRE